MANKPATPPAPGPAKPRSAAARKGPRIARKLAQSTLLAAGFAVAQFGTSEIDTRFHLFDPTLVDRLRAPITRYHE